ncbi:MAG: hypothetical protein L3J07_00460 [Candidatus Magasanikbacteria bacterium]|nr:hypothetical protein [Candidatus Magasanikbacteria bacterium]
MGKLKTHKATAKRFVIKKSKKGTKIISRTGGQDHFNARERGNTKRNKRKDNSISSGTVHKTILNAVPYKK